MNERGAIANSNGTATQVGAIGTGMYPALDAIVGDYAISF